MKKIRYRQEHLVYPVVFRFRRADYGTADVSFYEDRTLSVFAPGLGIDVTYDRGQPRPSTAAALRFLGVAMREREGGLI
jgi:hypothetical protein